MLVALNRGQTLVVDHGAAAVPASPALATA